MPRLDQIATGEKIGNIIDETVLIESGASTATTAAATVRRTTATTNTVEPALALNRQSSGTPATGIGASLVFDVETAAGNTERGATIEAVTTDVTNNSEDFDLVFKTMAAGAAAAEAGRLLSTKAWETPLNGGIAYRIAVPSQAVVGIGRNDSIAGLNLYGGTGTATGNAEVNVGTAKITLISTLGMAWASGTVNTAADTGLARNAAGVIRATNGSTGIRGFLGGGAAVASATALPVPTGRVFHVTGTTTVTSITSTNLAHGLVYTIIFDASLTFTHGNNIILAGAANFSATANDTITMAFDGTNHYEVCRSVN